MIPISPVGQRVFPSNTAQCWKCLPVVPVEIWGWSYPTVSLRPWLLLPSLSRRSPRKGLFEAAFDIYLLELLEKPLYLVSLSGFARNIILDYIVYLYMSIIAIPPILDFPRWFRFKIFEKKILQICFSTMMEMNGSEVCLGGDGDLYPGLQHDFVEFGMFWPQPSNVKAWRVMLVIFGGSNHLQVCLTLDHTRGNPFISLHIVQM